MIRVYICENCDFSFEKNQGFHDNLLKKCPKCKRHKLHQDWSGVHIAVIGDPTTVGHLAERNTKNMGKYELEEARKRRKDQGRAGKRKMLEESGKLPQDASLPPEVDHKPWYGKLPEDKKDVVKSPEKAKKYIFEGK